MIAVRLDTSNQLVDFSRDDIDVAIRSGSGDWPGVERHLLFKAGFTPMISPSLAASIGGVREPEDLLKLPLLDPHDPWWRDWFVAAGVPADTVERVLASRSGISMGAQAYEASAAMAGRGVAILTRALFDEAVGEGRLVQPIDLVANDGNAYWLVYPSGRRNVPKIRAFRDWLLAEVRDSVGRKQA